MPRTTTTKSSSTVIAEINGLEIRTGALYIVENKYDADAPNGLKELQTTMIPSEGNGINIQCRAVQTSENTFVYDTGLYPNSPCYKGLSKQEANTIIRNLKKYIQDPYEQGRGKDALLDHANESFWDTYMPFIYEGRVFNTDDPEDVLALYICMRSYALTPAGSEGDPRFERSSYVVRDASQSMNTQERLHTEKAMAVSSFVLLLEQDQKAATSLLRALSVIRISENPTKESAISSLSMWLERDVQNPSLYNRLHEKFLDKNSNGEEEVLLTVAVKKSIETGKIKRQGKFFYYKEFDELGMDLSSIVKNLINNETLVDAKEQILKLL